MMYVNLPDPLTPADGEAMDAALRAQIEDVCPTCGAPLRTFENEFKRTRTCDECGYHDVTFNWISD